MNILFVTEDLAAGNLAYVLTREGHEVKLCIQDKERRKNFENMVRKVHSWRSELAWVGRDGLIVFDGSHYGAIQDGLRAQGYSVVGGSMGGDRIENDRAYGDALFKKCGLSTVPLHDFTSLEAAKAYVKKHHRAWVIKQNSYGTHKGFNYVGMMPDGSDVVDMLDNYMHETKYKGGVITLQEKIHGVEIGVGRYFNGADWVGPIEYNLEHKKYFPGDLGPTTSEMGTVAWYNTDETNPLFVKTLVRMKAHLKKINFRGDFEINCIVNEKGIYPLEATPRFGSPIVHLQTDLHHSTWGKFLKAVADGRDHALEWKKGYGVVVVVTVPTSHPFPTKKSDRRVSPLGLRVYFDKHMGDDMDKIHFEDVSYKKVKKVDGKKKGGYYYISDDRGYVLYVTSVQPTVELAQKDAYRILRDKVHIPKMFYRNDIGTKFIETDHALLKKWGYMK
jgi:phosphoribosylamine---glycine ligase